MMRTGGSKSGGDRSSGCTCSKNRSHGDNSEGHKSGGHKNEGHKSEGHKNEGNKSGGHKCCCSKSSGSNSNILKILLRIGVGTPNVRIHFDGTSHVGVYLGISDGSVILNVRGVVAYIKITSITAVELGVKVNRKCKRKQSWKCRKT
ncbi:hypothetical protein AB4Z45_05020 [Paenibacillus sp. MCAF9]|uniref:hypothetical protein n=1 Tax=Paenibacillus sp. MCAF9 TaxID=3233046 RepID=UPI003F9E7316